jgi:hypothetical protein
MGAGADAVVGSVAMNRKSWNPVHTLFLGAVLFGALSAASNSTTAAAAEPEPLRAVRRLADVRIPDAPLAGSVLGESWKVSRAVLKGDTLTLYRDAQGGPSVEIARLAGAARHTLAAPLLDKAFKGDTAAAEKLGKIPKKPELESIRIQLDASNDFMEMSASSKNRVLRPGQSDYLCDLALPMVLEFGAAKDGKIPLKAYFTHEFGDQRILLGGTIDVEKR